MSKFEEYLEAVREAVLLQESNQEYEYSEAKVINNVISSKPELSKFLNSLTIDDLKKGVKVMEGGSYVNKRYISDVQNTSKLAGDVRMWFSYNGDKKGFEFPTIKESKRSVKITSSEKTSDLKLEYKDALKKIKSLGGRLPSLDEIKNIESKGMFYVSDETNDPKRAMVWDAVEKKSMMLPTANILSVAYIDKKGNLKII